MDSQKPTHDFNNRNSLDEGRGAKVWLESELDTVAKAGTRALENTKMFFGGTLTKASVLGSRAVKSTTRFVKENPAVSLAALVVVAIAVTQAVRARSPDKTEKLGHSSR